MGYPKLPTDAQRKAALDQLLYVRRRELSAAAFVRDRAEQYTIDSGVRIALQDIAAALQRGEHFEALKHGELDDLIAEMMKPRTPHPQTKEGK